MQTPDQLPGPVFVPHVAGKLVKLWAFLNRSAFFKRLAFADTWPIRVEIIGPLRKYQQGRLSDGRCIICALSPGRAAREQP
jgi:hypothetical protein